MFIYFLDAGLILLFLFLWSLWLLVEVLYLFYLRVPYLNCFLRWTNSLALHILPKSIPCSRSTQTNQFINLFLERWSIFEKFDFRFLAFKFVPWINAQKELYLWLVNDIMKLTNSLTFVWFIFVLLVLLVVFLLYFWSILSFLRSLSLPFDFFFRFFRLFDLLL